jgi:hypothetical protein
VPIIIIIIHFVTEVFLKETGTPRGVDVPHLGARPPHLDSQGNLRRVMRVHDL